MQSRRLQEDGGTSGRDLPGPPPRICTLRGRTGPQSSDPSYNVFHGSMFSFSIFSLVKMIRKELSNLLIIGKKKKRVKYIRVKCFIPNIMLNNGIIEIV